MQIKTFDARTLDAAQAAVRRALGEEALILATENTASGIRITAALEAPLRLSDLLADEAEDEAPDAEVARILAFHGVPPGLVRRLAQEAAGIGSPEAGLAQALRPHLKPAVPARRQLLTGPPGHGKTLATARLAHAALAEGRRPRLFTLGAPDRLRALVADTPLEVAALDGPAALTDLGAEADWLVDAEPLLVHRAADAGRLRALLQSVGGQGTLVLAAEGQPATLLELAMDHLALGCRAVLTTKLDASRRYGGLVALAAAGVPLAGLGIGPSASEPLAKPSARSLARLLVHQAAAGATP